MARKSRNRAMMIVTAAMVIVAGVIVWAVIGIRSDVKEALTKPEAPEPSQSDMADVPLTDEGVSVTVKQRDGGWLPGGKYKLHLDDITGGQVLVSVTDKDGRVVLTPRSVKKGKRFAMPDKSPVMEVEVIRLENVLTGEDFGEFAVKPAPAAIE